MSVRSRFMKTVEMITRGTNIAATMRHQLLARRMSFRFNVPAEKIKLVTKTVTRKDQADMSQVEQQQYINGIKRLMNSPINNGNYGQQVAIHGNMCHRMHVGMDGGGMCLVPDVPGSGQERFLPWHRVYLWEIEQLLIHVNPTSFIPYWDWTKDRDVPAWLQGFLPTVVVPQEDGNPPTTTINVHRGPHIGNLPDPGPVNALMNSTNKTYTEFATELEDFHKTVHGWVNGTMDDLMHSPADPLFWLHHANVDRIWSKWQAKNPGKNPNLTGTDALLDPWTFTEPETRDISNMGYSYA